MTVELPSNALPDQTALQANFWTRSSNFLNHNDGRKTIRVGNVRTRGQTPREPCNSGRSYRLSVFKFIVVDSKLDVSKIVSMVPIGGMISSRLTPYRTQTDSTLPAGTSIMPIL